MNNKQFRKDQRLRREAMFKDVKKGISQQEVAIRFGVSQSAVSLACKRVRADKAAKLKAKPK